MPKRDDLPWDPVLLATEPCPPAMEVEQIPQVVYIVSRVVEFVELGNGDLEHRLRLLHSLIQRDKQRNMLDYHTSAGALAATGNTAAAAEPTAEAEDLRGRRHVLAAEQDGRATARKEGQSVDELDDIRRRLTRLEEQGALSTVTAKTWIST